MTKKKNPNQKGISTAARKEKGRKGQKEVRDLIFLYFPELVLDKIITEDDQHVRSRGMGQAGNDVILSLYARKFLPWSIEVKRAKRFNLALAVDQAKKRADEGTIPVSLGKYDRHPTWYAGIEALNLLKLMRENYDLKKELQAVKNLLGKEYEDIEYIIGGE